jgi:hypothetical protein
MDKSVKGILVDLCLVLAAISGSGFPADEQTGPAMNPSTPL